MREGMLIVVEYHTRHGKYTTKRWCEEQTGFDYVDVEVKDILAKLRELDADVDSVKVYAVTELADLTGAV